MLHKNIRKGLAISFGILFLGATVIASTNGAFLKGDLSKIVENKPRVMKNNVTLSDFPFNQQVIDTKDLYLRKNILPAEFENNLKLRRDAFVKLMMRDPEKANQVQLSADFRQNLPENFKKYVETQKTIQGDLQVLYSDDFKSGISNYKYSVHTIDNHTFPIYASHLPIQPKMKIKASGVYLDDVGIAVSGQNSSTLFSPSPTDQTYGTGKYALLVVPIYKKQNQVDPAYIATINQNLQKLFFTAPESVKNFYQRNTYGAINFSGTVYQKPIEVNDDSWINTFDWGNLISIVDPAKIYNFYSFIAIDDNFGCGGAGYLGNVMGGADFGNTPTDRPVAVSFFSTTCVAPEHEPTFDHEIGHNLGLHHAGGYVGVGLNSTFPDPNHCTADIPLPAVNLNAMDCSHEYADDSIMGGNSGISMDLGLYQRKQIGAKFYSQSIVANGQYVLYSSSKSPLDNNYQELTIPSTNGYYTIEYRTQNKKEVVVRFVPTVNNINFLPSIPVDTLRPIPAGPYDYSNQDYSYLKGDTFMDSSRNLSIQVVDTTQDHALLSIEVQ